MTFREFLKDNIVVLDGGMGTLLQAEGIEPGANTAEWNLSHPDVITAIHRAYFDAGSNVVNTNTFGANTLRMSEEELRETVRAAIDNARRARAESSSDREMFIALDVGPTGKMLRPYGTLDFEDAVDIFKKTISAGAEYGVDLIYIETMNDMYEAKAAILAAKEACDLPVMISCAFDEKGKMMTGGSPAVLTAVAEGMGVDAVGLNCSVGPDKLGAVVDEFLRKASVPVIFKPNADLPDADGNYNMRPEDFAGYCASAVGKGVRLVGGCCGTTPDFIAAVRKAADGLSPVPLTRKELTVAASYSKITDFSVRPVVIGERINPTGKKLLKKALAEKNIDYIIEEVFAQEEAGADCLDINAGAPEVDETEMLPLIVSEIQAVSSLPLQLDSSDFTALEKAMRIYNGKPVVNSVNGSAKSIAGVMPLVRKYGGVLVCLTLDEDGIPDTVDARLAIAEKIINAADKYGIPRNDLVFDPLTTTVATAADAGLVTLGAVKMITEELGCKTVLGVSNVSFGLPARPVLNSFFLSLAIYGGLSAAIINPCSAEMMSAVYATRALLGLDADFSGYTGHAQADAGKPAETQKKPAGLADAIKKGLADEAAKQTEKLLKEKSALDIINQDIIPALDEVGDKYEKNVIFLPGLLISASAAKSAFEVIKARSGENGGADKGVFVIATVEGDVHDIGKNIVKLILENYGFNVIDLGKNVAPAIIADKVTETGTRLLGLSALMTTTLPAMKETIDAVKAVAPDCRICVGGAVLTEEYASSIGADKYCPDAMSTVRYALSVTDGET